MNKNSFLATTFLGVLASVSTALSASAATVTGAVFNLIGPNALSPSFDFSSSDIGLTATALTGDVSRNFWGLGVKRNQVDRPQVDGRGPDDVLNLTFDKEVSLERALFTFVDRNDGARVTVDGDRLFEGDLPGANFLSFVSFNENRNTGFSFNFGVLDQNDNYRLSRVRVTHLADGTTIPEPFTILGTMAAVGVGTVIKRRHSQIGE